MTRSFEDKRHSNLVADLVKSGEDILKDMSPNRVEMLHAAAGIAGEAGETLDLIKKTVFNNRELDREKLVKELGDIEFYLEALRQAVGMTREQTLEAVYDKLTLRYKDGYSDKAAAERADEKGK